MASPIVFGNLCFLLFVGQLMAFDLHNMTIEDYVNYINPPAVHKYEHENGDTILCVKHEDQISLNTYKIDRYGFSNRDRKNKEVKPSSMKGGSCPEGSVHVREIKHEHVKRAGSVAKFATINNEIDDSFAVEHAMASLIYGEGDVEKASGVMNVWQPTLDRNDIRSSGFIRIGVEYGFKKLQTIEAGWQVTLIYGSPTPRFFVLWTGGERIGCYDLRCPGLVMEKNAPLYPGQPLSQVSVYGDKSKQAELDISIHYERRNPPAWVISVGSKPVPVCYLPARLVPDILPKINTVKWGGEVHVWKKTPPSKADMGSGRFPESGYPKAAYVRNMGVFKAGDKILYGGSFEYRQSRPYCYKVSPDGGSPNWGDYIFYGGPGGDFPECK